MASIESGLWTCINDHNIKALSEFSYATDTNCNNLDQKVLHKKIGFDNGSQANNNILEEDEVLIEYKTCYEATMNNLEKFAAGKSDSKHETGVILGDYYYTIINKHQTQDSCDFFDQEIWRFDKDLNYEKITDINKTSPNVDDCIDNRLEIEAIRQNSPYLIMIFTFLLKENQTQENKDLWKINKDDPKNPIKISQSSWSKINFIYNYNNEKIIIYALNNDDQLSLFELNPNDGSIIRNKYSHDLNNYHFHILTIYDEYVYLSWFSTQSSHNVRLHDSIAIYNIKDKSFKLDKKISNIKDINTLSIKATEDGIFFTYRKLSNKSSVAFLSKDSIFKKIDPPNGVIVYYEEIDQLINDHYVVYFIGFHQHHQTEM